MKKILFLTIFFFSIINASDIKKESKHKQYWIEFILKKDFKSFPEKSKKLGKIKSAFEDWKLIYFEFKKEISESEIISLFDKNAIGNYKFWSPIIYYGVNE